MRTCATILQEGNLNKYLTVFNVTVVTSVELMYLNSCEPLLTVPHIEYLFTCYCLFYAPCKCRIKTPKKIHYFNINIKTGFMLLQKNPQTIEHTEKLFQRCFKRVSTLHFSTSKNAKKIYDLNSGQALVQSI